MDKMGPESPVASVYSEHDLRVQMRYAGVQQQQPGLVSLDDECGALVPQLAAIICAVRGSPAITSADMVMGLLYINN